jgi:hypothetical protein
MLPGMTDRLACVYSQSEKFEDISVPVRLSDCQTCLGSGSEFKLQTCLSVPYRPSPVI